MPDDSKKPGSSSAGSSQKAGDQKPSDQKAGDQRTGSQRTTETTTTPEPPLAGPTGATDTVAAGSPPSKSQAAKLAPASESGDPDVHRLLAERQTAQTNLDAVTPDDAAKQQAEEYRRQIDAIDAQLADLGFSAR